MNGLTVRWLAVSPHRIGASVSSAQRPVLGTSHLSSWVGNLRRLATEGVHEEGFEPPSYGFKARRLTVSLLVSGGSAETQVYCSNPIVLPHL